MEKNSQIIKKQLNKILKGNKYKEGVVISLSGYWGIGKTFFWKKYAKKLQKKLQKKLEEKLKNEQSENNENTDLSLKDKLLNVLKEKTSTALEASEMLDKLISANKNVKVIYISLFGLHSTKDIKSKIFTKMSIKNEKIDNIQKKLGKSKILGIDLANAIEIFKSDDFKNTIICFDDFERLSSNLNIREVLGFISELKEDKKCKIVIINNNNSLNEQDSLNIKKIITLDEVNKSHKIDKTIIQTNNNAIFSKYAEKIIDFEFFYNPTVKDNLDAIKKTLIANDELKSINWDLIENFLKEHIKPDIKCNIRYMKKLIYKLYLFKNFIDMNIHEDIKDYIILKILANIYDYKTDINLKFLYTLKDLETYIFALYEKEYIDESSFIKKLNTVNKEYIENEKNEKNEKFVTDIYNKLNNFYFSDMKDTDFVSEIYNKLIEKKNKLHEIYSFNFISLIPKIKDIANNKNDELDKLEKDVIINILKNIGSDKRYEPKVIALSGIWDKDIEIKKLCEIYFSRIKENETSDYIYEETKNKLETYPNNMTINTINFLQNISKDKHLEYILKGDGYFKICINFIKINLTFIGDTFFDKYTIDLIDILYNLYQDKNDEIYKDKIKRFFNEIQSNFMQKKQKFRVQNEDFDETLKKLSLEY